MNWLFDSPFTILLAALGIGFFLGVAWVQTGKNGFLYAVGGLVVVALLLLILERTTETDGERVTRLVYQIASEIETNDSDRVVTHIVSSKPELIALARKEMKPHTFDDVTITKIFSVEELPQKEPPQVIIEFNVSVGGNFMQGQVPLENRIIFFKLTFWKDNDGEWRIADYEYDANRPFPRAK